MLVAALALGVFIAGPASAKVLRWKMTTSWPAGIPLYTDMAELYAQNVEKLSGGQIKIQVLPGGAIAPALEVTDSVREGIAELGHTWPGYDIGRGPTTAIFGGYAGGMEPVPMPHWLYTGGGKELWRKYREEKFGVVSFPCGIRPPEAFAHSHKPIRTLDDFKGLKMRTVGAWAQILPGLGASVVSLPGGEVYQALERKVIDATEWATPGENVISGFHEIAKYVIVPGAHQPSAPFEITINKKKFDALSDDLKAVLEQAAELTTFESWVRIGRLDMGAMEKFRKTGNEIIFLSPETQKRAHELGQEWAAKIAKDNAWFKKVYDSQNAFEAQWQQVGSIRYFQR
ncbi:MAG: C4-dicarboxylate ABC transporter substrate-binding protein [bacterium]|nr:C4-dicarboxylate ABC transporter substrate-binding protein [bacterium]